MMMNKSKSKLQSAKKTNRKIMDEFINSLDTRTFESTNSLWNNLMLNDPWSVGYVSTLIEMETFKSKEDWEVFYYHSGGIRNSKISGLTKDIQEKLNDEQLVLRQKSEILNMNWELKSFNYNFGRTVEQIKNKGKILFHEANLKGLIITEQECIEAVRFRTICQTWNGIKIREKNTIKVLQQHFPAIDFVSTTGDIDYSFAVDYNLKISDRLICGIQIKPKSYLGNAPYLRKAKIANTRKNQSYENHFGKPVVNIISKMNGELINIDIINIIARFIRK